MSKLCLVVIDGFGVAPAGPGNARSQAKMPTLDRLTKEVPNCLMDASGNAVGLPEGQQGASEPGHLTLGAGRIVWQPLEEINQSIKSGDFYKNKVLIDACKRANAKKVPLHLIGMYSSGGVHSFHQHFHAMLNLAEKEKVERVVLHLFADGRDTAEQHFCIDYDVLKADLSKKSFAKVASLIGRYYAMDRDRQLVDRTKFAYDLLTQGIGEEVDDLCEGAKAWYIKAPDKEKTDYYIRPLKTPDYVPVGENDVGVMINFRTDRMFQIVAALEGENFTDFSRPVRVKDLVCVGPYSDHLPIAFPADPAKNSFGEVVSKAGLKQLRIAETDKMAHVTFFFNQQIQEPFKGEDRMLVESPKVSNFALAPEMSANELTTRVIEEIEKEKYELIVMNYANPDLVGHGGDIAAVVKGCETVDKNLEKLLPVLEAHGYDWVITSDHGNSEEMYYPGTNTICPSHTTNQVQTFVHSANVTEQDLKGLKGLSQIAPLCLKIMGLEVPAEMTGK